MHRLLASIILIFLFLPTAAAVGGTDGNTLLKDCTQFLSKDELGYFGSGQCGGTLVGIVGTHDIFVQFKNSEKYFCVPSAVTFFQIARVTVKYLNEHPESLHKDGVSLAISALALAFPCNNQST